MNSHASRREGLRTLRARHQGQFGVDSKYGLVSAINYNAEASFHKQHRNGSKVENRIDFLRLPTRASVFIITVTEATLSADDNKRFTVTDANGVTTTFRITGGAGKTAQNGNPYTPGTETEFGYDTLSTQDTVRDALILKINSGTNIAYTATADGLNAKSWALNLSNQPT